MYLWFFIMCAVLLAGAFLVPDEGGAK